MSEVKIYAANLPGNEDSKPPYYCRPATPAEIMDAHPVCRDCKHSTRWLCANPFAAEGQQGHVIDTDTHYCRHWEAKQ